MAAQQHTLALRACTPGAIAKVAVPPAGAAPLLTTIMMGLLSSVCLMYRGQVDAVFKTGLRQIGGAARQSRLAMTDKEDMQEFSGRVRGLQVACISTLQVFTANNTASAHDRGNLE